MKTSQIADTDLRPLIEENVLKRLGLEIIDLETLTEYAIPDGFARYQVYRHYRYFCSISKWGERYHTRAINNLNGWDSVYEAATCWVSKDVLARLENQAQVQIVEQQLSMPDYF